MSQHILLISPSEENGDLLSAGLQALGYAATRFETLIKPSTQTHPASLCIIDLQLYRELGPVLWEDWLRDCRVMHTACLAFDRTEPPDSSRIASLEPLSDTLTHIEDPSHLRDKITSLLTVRKLSRQLEATRHQLASFQAELQEALQSAAHIQRTLIPLYCPNYNNLHYSWRFLPSKQVGGDLFNVVQLDEETVMTYLVDVSGHGLSSAMVTVSVHQSLSLYTSQIVKQSIEQPPYYQITEPHKVLQSLETEYPFERFEEFFTISYMLINPQNGQIRYCNAGHPPPLLLRCDGSVERLDKGGTIVGMGSALGFEEGRIRLQNGDRLFLYTDGITEHVDANGQIFAEARLQEQLQKHSAETLDDTIQNTLIAMRQFGGSSLPVDDITLIGIEFAQRTSSEETEKV